MSSVMASSSTVLARLDKIELKLLTGWRSFPASMYTVRKASVLGFCEVMNDGSLRCFTGVWCCTAPFNLFDADVAAAGFRVSGRELMMTSGGLESGICS
jgi:hypothetical protein